MNDLLSNLIESLKGTSAGTKLVAVLSGVTMLGILGVAFMMSNRPELRPTIMGLSDHEVGTVSKALADAGIPFEVSAGTAPYNIAVDEDNRSDAFAAAYGSGALDRPLRGIAVGEGVTSVFNSAEERRQGVRKKDWGEMELMLETLSFVTAATVRTSAGRTSPIERDPAPMTASVTLRTAGELTVGQKTTVARIVSSGLGIQRNHIMVADHEGNMIFDGSREKEGGGLSGLDARESEAAYDERLAEQANRVLDTVLGPGMAHVVVTSEWDYTMMTEREESSSGQAGNVVIEETTESTDRTQATSIGGAAGVTSNTAQNAGDSSPSVTTTPLEKTSKTTKRYAPTISTSESVREVPLLKRLSVALFLDESIDSARADQLEANVKAAVGYSETRDDSFSLATFPTPVVEETPAEAVEVPTAPNPLMDKLLRRGVEIATALVFLVLLLKTLKGSNKQATLQPATAAAAAEEDVDPEVLARAKVEELLRSDPDKVGEILSNWAREEELAGSKS